MSKAILILDEMPKTCGQCRYFITEQIENNTVQYCLSGKEGFVDIKELDDKPKWCPLKPLGLKVEEYGLETWNTRDGIFLCEKGLFDKLYGDDEE